MQDRGTPQGWMSRIRELLWERKLSEMDPVRRFGLRQLRTAVLVLQDFTVNQCLLRAAALTYYTMLSLVPLLALTFALLKAFGVQNLLQPLIIDKLDVGDGRAAEAILSYINNTQVAQLGGFGLLFLLIAVISLLTNVEKAFNHIWGVEQLRPLLRRFADYLSVVLVGPVLIISAISMTSTLASHRLVQKLIELQMVGSLILLLFKIAPFVFMWLAFTVLYVFMSNTRVEWRAAFAGGVVGGTLWQLAQLGYVYFQVGVGRYNAIYGTMAALPIFMVWLYLSWLIVLFGLGVTYARQSLRVGARDLRVSEISRNGLEEVALTLLVTLSERFSRGDPALSGGQLAGLLGLPPRLCRDVLRILEKLGMVASSCGSTGHYRYQLGRSAEDLTLAELFRHLREHGESDFSRTGHGQALIAHEICTELQDITESHLEGLTLRGLMTRYPLHATDPGTRGGQGSV